MLKSQINTDICEEWCHRAGCDLNKDINFTNNQHILQRIIEAGVLCARQKSALGGQRKQQYQIVDENREQYPNCPKFIVTVKAFEKCDEILRNHFLDGHVIHKIYHQEFRIKSLVP